LKRLQGTDLIELVYSLFLESKPYLTRLPSAENWQHQSIWWGNSSRIL